MFGPASLLHLAGNAQASATGPRCLSLSGLATERIVWIRPPSTSNATVPATLPSRSRTIAPGWPFNAHGSTLASILTSNGKTETRTRATLSAPNTLLASAGAAAAICDHFDVYAASIYESVDIAIPERIEEPRG